ncbi:MAG: hypothetical protein IKZ29_07650 [Clostridiales bacterium]|nr:hypothetical protein [Clostridiales bacterium]
MHRKIACLLALALTVTSLASCNMAGSDRSDDLYVEREGGDYKHEYGNETETDPILTTETTEDPTTTTTTSSDNSSSTDLTPVSGLEFWEFCLQMTNAMGDNYNDVESMIASFSANGMTETYSGSDESTAWIFYNCDIRVGNYSFDICNITYNITDGQVLELDFAISANEADAKKLNDEIIAELIEVYGEPTSTVSESSYEIVAFESSEKNYSVSTYYGTDSAGFYVCFWAI